METTAKKTSFYPLTTQQMNIPSTAPAGTYRTLNKKKPKRNRTGEIVLIFVCLGFIFMYLFALDKSHYFQAKKNCQSIYKNLELINTEATPERMDLENAYFQLGCDKR